MVNAVSRVLLAAAVVCVLALGAAASPKTDMVLDALRIGDLMRIMQAEAEASGQELDDGMLGGSGGPGWAATVSRINDAARMERDLRREFASHLDDGAADLANDFLRSDRGQRIIELELSAREALLDPAIDALNREATETARAEGGARVAQIERFVEVNNLIDANVAGAMMGNVAFLRGLRSGGFPPYARTSDQALVEEVLAQEPALRRDTEEWVYAFLTLAYGPLSDSDLEAYIAFSETDAGQALNAALFEAFDVVFTEASRALGEAVARHLTAEEI